MIHAFQPRVAELKALFEKSIELAWLVFGENAFRRWKPADANEPGVWESKRLNASLWDTLLYTFGFYEKRQVVSIADAVSEEFIDMSVNDPYFDQYVLTTGDKPDRVRYRADSGASAWTSWCACPQAKRAASPAT